MIRTYDVSGEYPVSTTEAVPEVQISGNLWEDSENVIEVNVGSPIGIIISFSGKDKTHL